MKLAVALMRRADAQRRIEQIKGRLLRNARVQEGDEPAEDLGELQVEFRQIAGELVELIQRINRTNMAAGLNESMTIADALALRDVLRMRQGAYAELAVAAVINQTRHSRSEVRFVSAVNVADIQAQADTMAREARQLDERIQEANWLVDLAG